MKYYIIDMLVFSFFAIVTVIAVSGQEVSMQVLRIGFAFLCLCIAIYKTSKLIHCIKICKKGMLTYGVVVGTEDVYSIMKQSHYVHTIVCVKAIMEDNSVRPFAGIKIRYPNFGLGDTVRVRYYKDEIYILQSGDWKKGERAINSEEATILERIRRTHRL